MGAGGHVDHSRALEVAIDVVPLDRRFDLVEVLQAEFLEQRQFLREAFLTVGDTVGQARLHEPAVAATRGRADLVGIDQHHVARRVALLGDDRRPQTRVPAADDAQVARLGAHQRGIAVGFVGVVVPVRVWVGVGDRVEMELVDYVVVVTVVDGHWISPPVGVRR